jgi:hypothetical protein
LQKKLNWLNLFFQLRKKATFCKKKKSGWQLANRGQVKKTLNASYNQLKAGSSSMPVPEPPSPCTATPSTTPNTAPSPTAPQ